MKILHGLPRGVKGKVARIPSEYWTDPGYFSKLSPYNCTQILAGAVDGELVGLNTEQGLVNIAGAGSGKSVMMKTNAILYRGNMVIVDPKGDIAEDTAQWRDEVHKQIIFIFALGVTLSKRLKKYLARWNPLDNLGELEHLLENIAKVSDGLMKPDPKAEAHWIDSGRTFLEGVILHVVTCNLYEGKRNLITVHRLITKGKPLPGEDTPSMKGLVMEMLQNAQILKDKDEDLGEALEGMTFDFWDREDRERNSVLSTVRTHLKFLYYKSIRKVLTPDPTQRTLKNLDILKAGHATVYASISVGMLPVFSPFLRVLINMTLEMVERVKVRPKAALLIVMDEFFVIGYSKEIDNAAGFIRGFHVKFLIILQTLTQLQSNFDNWEVFLGNNCLQCFGNNDMATLEYIEKRCGQTPVKVVQQSIAKTEAVGSESISEQLHPLITAQEAAKFFSRNDPLKRQLVIQPGFDPIILQRIEWYRKDAPYHQKYFSKFCRFLEQRTR